MKKKKSKAGKGNYYKLKTKKYFIEKGYACDYTEKLQRIFTPRGIVFIKRDLFGADGIAMNTQEIIFWNSKLGRKHIAEGKEEFSKFPYPPQVRRVLVVWEEGNGTPELINCTEE